MIRCQRCVIPDTRPDTPFFDGVCAACITYQKRPSGDWKTHEQELRDLIARHKNPRGFDCIVPSSGGKDSTWQALKLIELGARPLVVTATTCMLTDTGRRNIDNLARYATTIEVTPNREVRAKLNRLGLEMVGDISWPEHAAIFSIPFRVACDMRIPLMFYGENPQSQYGGPPGTEEARTMTRRWVTEFGGFLGLRPSDFEDIDERDLLDYTAPSEERLAECGIEAHFLGQYIPWDSHRNAEVAKEHGMECRLPCEANWWEAENLDCGMTGLHDHGMYRKYGFGRLAAQISVDIRAGRITREEALAVVVERDGLFPRTYMGVPVGRVLHRIGISEARLFEILDSFTNWDLFDGQANGRPLLREEALV